MWRFEAGVTPGSPDSLTSVPSIGVCCRRSLFIWNYCFFSLFISPFFPQCKVDKLVFIDVAESSTKGGSTDLEIFSLPNVEVSRGTSHSAPSPGGARRAAGLSHRRIVARWAAGRWLICQRPLTGGRFAERIPLCRLCLFFFSTPQSCRLPPAPRWWWSLPTRGAASSPTSPWCRRTWTCTGGSSPAWRASVPARSWSWRRNQVE